MQVQVQVEDRACWDRATVRMEEEWPCGQCLIAGMLHGVEAQAVHLLSRDRSTR